MSNGNYFPLQFMHLQRLEYTGIKKLDELWVRLASALDVSLVWHCLISVTFPLKEMTVRQQNTTIKIALLLW